MISYLKNTLGGYTSIVMLVFVAILIYTAYSSGLDKGRKELADYKLFVKAIGESQEAKTKQVITSHQQIADEANDEATKLRAALTSYFANPRVHVDYGSSVSKLPAIPKASQRVDASATELELNTCRAKAAEDALTLLMWQQWADRIIELGR